jgi:hypothetical protein
MVKNVVSGLISGVVCGVAVSLAASASAAVLTFDNLQLSAPQSFVEDGLRVTIGDQFLVSQSFGSPPSGLVDTRTGTVPTIVTRDDGGLFVFNGLGTLSTVPERPELQADSIVVIGFRNGQQQFGISSGSPATVPPIGIPSFDRPIDTLEISFLISNTQEVAFVADNIHFTFVDIPEPPFLSLMALGISLIYLLRRIGLSERVRPTSSRK